MLPAERFGVPRYLDGVHEHVGDDLRVLGAVAGGDETYPLDKYHFRSMAAPCGVALYSLLCQFGEIFAFLRLDEHVLGLAVYDSVRSEWGEHALGLLHHRLDQGVASDLEGLEPASGAAEDCPDGRHDLADAVADRRIPFRDGLHLRFEGREHRIVDPLYLFRAVRSHEDAVVLQEDDLRLVACGLPVCLYLVVDLLEEGVSRVGVGDVEGFREEFLALLFRHG